MKTKLTLLGLFLLVASAGSIWRTAVPAAAQTGDTTPKVVAAANAFLATLSDREKAAVQFAWTDEAQKTRWSNFPDGAFQRAGLVWGNLSPASQNTWLDVMKATLSPEGYNRVYNEWHADQANANVSGTNGGVRFGLSYYYIALIGAPSETSPWMWQFGGHHVTVNATIVGPNITLTPSFIGSQPVTYTINGTTVRTLGDIDDTAVALLQSLDATQQAQAVLGTSNIDLVTGVGADDRAAPVEGLPGSAMTAAQQATFLKLAGYYINLLNADDAAPKLATLQANLANTYIVYYGSIADPATAYWRVTGPTVVIEFAPQGGAAGVGVTGSGGPGANGTPGAGANGTPGARGTPGAAFPGGTPGAGGAGGAGGTGGATLGGVLPTVTVPVPTQTALASQYVAVNGIDPATEHIHGVFRDPTNEYGAAYVSNTGTPTSAGTSVAGATATVGQTTVGMPTTGAGDQNDGGILLLIGLAVVLLAFGGVIAWRMRTPRRA